MLAYTRFEVVRTIRNVRFMFITLAMPVVLFLLLNQLEHGASGAAGMYVMVAMAGFSMFNAAIGANSGSLPTERASGWLRQLRITPLSGAGWLVAKLALATAVVVPGLAAISVCAIVFGHVQMGAGQWAAFVALVLGGSIPFGFLGLLLGQLLDQQAAQPVQGILSMLLSFGGGLFFPMSSFPDAVQAIAQLLPTHLYFAIGQALVAGQVPAVSDVAGLAVWAAALAAGALAIWFQQGSRRLAMA